MTRPGHGFQLFFAFDPVELATLGIDVCVLRNTIVTDLVRRTHLEISFGPLMNQIICCPPCRQLRRSTNSKHLDKTSG